MRLLSYFFSNVLPRSLIYSVPLLYSCCLRSKNVVKAETQSREDRKSFLFKQVAKMPKYQVSNTMQSTFYNTLTKQVPPEPNPAIGLTATAAKKPRSIVTSSRSQRVSMSILASCFLTKI